MTLVINSIIFIDLYFTLKNPFYPREKRTKFYYLLLIAMFTEQILVYVIFKPSGPGFSGTKLFISQGFSVTLSAFTIFAAISVLLRLSIKGTSQELKN